MKTKLEMAHEWAIELLRAGDSSDDVISCAWRYADAMQAEAEKRRNKPYDFVPAIMEGIRNAELEEWQPDWSQAPDWANWWAMDGFSKKANWYIDKPYLDDDSEVESEWNIDLKTNTETYMHAPSFNYQGDWRESLRKRPN